MSILLDPHKEFDRFIATKQPYMYPAPVKVERDLLTADKNEPTDLIGSYVQRIQKYPGDIDMFEYFVQDHDKQKVINKFEKEFKKIVRHVLAKRQHYYSEIKVGIDKRYDIKIGKLEQGNYKPAIGLEELIRKIYKQKLLTKEEAQIIIHILMKGQGYHLDADDYDVINNIIREHKILRWTAKEIERGALIRNGQMITLNEALGDNSLVKIDEITFINGNIVEVTNIYLLGYFDKNGDPIYINPIPNINPVEKTDKSQGLKEEIEKLYYSNMFYSPFKMIKRLFSLLKISDFRDTPMAKNFLIKLFPLISSNVSMLYQINSELSTIQLLLERSKSIPYTAIRDQISIIIDKVSNNIDLTDDQTYIFINFINRVLDTRNKSEMLHHLESAIQFFKRIINFQTIAYLNRIGANPLPDFVLPFILKYDRSLVRRPFDNPVNPMKKYAKISGGYENIVQSRNAL